MDEQKQVSMPTRADLWHEAMAHLRYLNDELWKRFQFFLWLDVALLFAMFVINRHSWLIVFILAIGGLLLTLVARYVLRRNRIYYLQMLLKKTLLEDGLTFYESTFENTETDLAFPWRVAPEKLPQMKERPDEWVRENIRPSGSIARWLFVVYEVFLGIFAAAILLLLALAFR